jgi:voltage-gated potassium channel
MARRDLLLRLRRRLYDILDQGPHGDRLSAAVSRGLILLVCINIAAVILESIPSLEARYGEWFDLLEFL